jgi:hypothetical protein
VAYLKCPSPLKLGKIELLLQKQSPLEKLGKGGTFDRRHPKNAVAIPRWNEGNQNSDM